MSEKTPTHEQLRRAAPSMFKALTVVKGRLKRAESDAYYPHYDIPERDMQSMLRYVNEALELANQPVLAPDYLSIFQFIDSDGEAAWVAAPDIKTAASVALRKGWTAPKRLSDALIFTAEKVREYNLQTAEDYSSFGVDVIARHAQEEPDDAWFILHYECPDCGHTWEDEWDSAVDSDCPHCKSRDISPCQVTNIYDWEPT